MTSFLLEIDLLRRLIPVTDDKRALIDDAYAMLREAVLSFNTVPSQPNLVVLNGAWAYATRVVNIINVPEPEPPFSGDTRATEFQDQNEEEAREVMAA